MFTGTIDSKRGSAGESWWRGYRIIESDGVATDELCQKRCRPRWGRDLAGRPRLARAWRHATGLRTRGFSMAWCKLGALQEVRTVTALYFHVRPVHGTVLAARTTCIVKRCVRRTEYHLQYYNVSVVR
jgi:hypothetical protein